MPAQLTMISCCESHGAECDCLPYIKSGEQPISQMSHTCHSPRNLGLQLKKKYHSYLDSSMGENMDMFNLVEHENIKVWKNKIDIQQEAKTNDGLAEILGFLINLLSLKSIRFLGSSPTHSSLCSQSHFKIFFLCFKDVDIKILNYL